MSYTSVKDRYLNDPQYSQFRPVTWESGELPISFIQLTQGDVDVIDSATHSFTLGVGLGGNISFEIDFGDGNKKFSGASQGAYLNPTRSDVRYRQSGRCELLILDCPYQRLAEALGVGDEEHLADILQPLHDQVIHDLDIKHRCLDLWGRSRHYGAFDALAIDHGFLSLVASLASSCRKSADDNATSSSTLYKSAIRRLDEYIAAHLDGPIAVHDLARLFSMPSWQFIQYLKATIGKTPHQYVLDYRIQRARELLASRDMPLAQVAYHCGFSSQSHMNDVFRRKLGVTPGHYRKELGR